MRFMITDGGPHPADKWAEISAAAVCDLIQIDERSATKAAIAARMAKLQLQVKLAAVLVGHHAKVQDRERKELSEHGHVRLSQSCDPRESVPELLAKAVDDVVACTADTPFNDHFNKPGVKEAIKGMLGSHFASVMHVERAWHSDGKVIEDGVVKNNTGHDAKDEHVVAFRERHSLDQA